MIFNKKLFSKILTIGWTTAPDSFTEGTSNMTEDIMFVPYLDYDNVYLSVVKQDCKKLQKIFNLSNLFVFESSKEISSNEEEKGNYHVIGLDKLTFWEHMEILQHTRCDFMAKRMGRFYPYRNWVLRIGDKLDSNGNKLKSHPKFKCIFANNGIRHKSNGHRLMLNRLYKLIIPKDKLFDKYTTTEIIPYLAKSKQ